MYRNWPQGLVMFIFKTIFVVFLHFLLQRQKRHFLTSWRDSKFHPDTLTCFNQRFVSAQSSGAACFIRLQLPHDSLSHGYLTLISFLPSVCPICLLELLFLSWQHLFLLSVKQALSFSGTPTCGSDTAVIIWNQIHIKSVDFGQHLMGCVPSWQKFYFFILTSVFAEVWAAL